MIGVGLKKTGLRTRTKIAPKLPPPPLKDIHSDSHLFLLCDCHL